MLDHLRKLKRSIMGLMVIFFMAGLMATFGLQGPSNYAGRSNPETPALVVNGKEITHEEYQEQVRNLDAMGRRQFGQNYERIRGMLNIPGRVVDNLISQNLFYGLIGDLGLDAGVGQVRDFILQTYFPTGFNEELYVSMLRQSGLSEEQHQDRVRRQIAANQLQDLLADASLVSEAELKAKYRTENTKYAFQYVVINALDYENKVDLADEAALKKYYDDHKSQFKKGKSIRYTVVEFPTAEFSAKVDVTQDDLEEAYETNVKKFTEPKQVLVKRMAWSKEKKAPSSLEEMMNPDAKSETPGSEEKKKKADAALKRLKDGEDFDKVKAENGENVSGPGSIDDGAWLVVANIDPKFRPAAQKLQKGEYSSVIETDAGYFIIRLEDVKPQRVKPMDEVKSEVEAMVRKNLAPTYAIASAESFVNEWEKKSKEREISLTDYAVSVSRSAKATDRPFYEGEAPEGLPQALTGKAFTLGAGSRESITVDGRVFVIDVGEVKPAFVPEFNDVKAEVTSAYKTEKARELAKTAAQTLLDEARAVPLSAGVSRLAPAAKTRGFEVKTSEPKTRSEARGSAPFETTESADSAFALSDSEPLLKNAVEAGPNIYSIELSSITLPDEGDWAKNKKEMIKAEMKRGGQNLAQSLLANLKRHATIVDNTKAERAAAGGPVPIDVVEH